jgi:hypothetical protein
MSTKDKEQREEEAQAVVGSEGGAAPLGGAHRTENPKRDDDDIAPSMTGGSQHDRSSHSGSRDVTEGTTGNAGTEVGGTRNYRQGTGAISSDIGGRPE